MLDIKYKIPVLVVRDLIMFPDMSVPLFVGRDKSIRTLLSASEKGDKILLVGQKDPAQNDPNLKELYKVGVICQILQVLRLNDDTLKTLIEGKRRVKVKKYENFANEIFATYVNFENEPYVETDELIMIKRTIIEQFELYIQSNPRINPEIIMHLNNLTDLHKFADAVSANLVIKVAHKQQILEIANLEKKLRKILEYLQLEIELIRAEHRIKKRIKNQIEQHHKKYYLHEQIKAIHEELGEEDNKEELTSLASKISSLKLTQEAREKAEAELKKLKYMSPASGETAIVRNYIDWIIELPWQVYSQLNKNLSTAQKILDKEHYGLEKAKERVLEYMAVNIRTDKLDSPIICFVGPPGAGKTSLVESIGEATGRKVVKISLGGVHDEGEIRGHRRTYMGALPGKILQSMKKAGVSNPIILLDEIDKMGHDYRGDPAAALLEVLDPKQNHKFSDHYLDLDYDLSQVMFIATANSLDNISHPLLDRMEVIRLSGYTEEEKINITTQYLIPKQFSSHGIKEGELEITPESVVEIIRYYTSEAGVRGLERNIAKIARKAVKKILTEKVKSIKVTTKNLSKFLGVRKYLFGQIEEKDLVGIANGLAYSEVGGDLLSIETVLLYGKGGNVKITGKLGDVMKESAEAALSYIRSKAPDYGINPSVFTYKDIHIHVPEGATPKDGPSAGITISVSLVSILTGIPVRKDVAMTGEITLRGKVLPIGGLKEKLLAALRGGVRKVIIPQRNMKDLEEVPTSVKKYLEIVGVDTVDEVFKHTLTRNFIPIQWSPEQELLTLELSKAEHHFFRQDK